MEALVERCLNLIELETLSKEDLIVLTSQLLMRFGAFLHWGEAPDRPKHLDEELIESLSGKESIGTVLIKSGWKLQNSI
jgi:hypothetical protein